VAGAYITRLAGPLRDYAGALSQYGGSSAYAQRVLRLAADPLPGRPLDCAHPAMTQPFGPVAGVIVNGAQIEPYIGGSPVHPGVDLACASGTAVRAVAGGTARAFYETSGYGLSVVV